jgi:diguanylate cyclase
MVNLLDEHNRTFAFAQVALGQIKSLRQTAVPRNCEIWYVYATGYNPPLNKIINETLARNGKLTEADLEHAGHVDELWGHARRRKRRTRNGADAGAGQGDC